MPPQSCYGIISSIETRERSGRTEEEDPAILSLQCGWRLCLSALIQSQDRKSQVDDGTNDHGQRWKDWATGTARRRLNILEQLTYIYTRTSLHVHDKVTGDVTGGTIMLPLGKSACPTRDNSDVRWDRYPSGQDFRAHARVFHRSRDRAYRIVRRCIRQIVRFLFSDAQVRHIRHSIFVARRTSNRDSMMFLSTCIVKWRAHVTYHIINSELHPCNCVAKKACTISGASAPESRLNELAMYILRIIHI